MTLQKSIALLLFACVVPSWGGAAQAANILQNPGFEDGVLSPWYQDRVFSNEPEDVDWDVTSGSANSGNWSAVNIGNRELRQDFAGVPTEDVTEVSFWTRHVPGSTTALAVELFYLGGTEDQFLVDTDGAEEWEKFDVTSQLNSGETLVGFSVFGNSIDTTQTFLDDVVIDAVPEPATAALALIALAPLFRRHGA